MRPSGPTTWSPLHRIRHLTRAFGWYGGAFAKGATSVVVDRDTAVSPSRLAEAIRLHGITAMFLTTALFNHIVRSDPSSLRGLETLLFGGERCDPATVQRACSAGAVRRLVHVYGPTECTTFALFHEVGTLRPEDVTEGGATVPIGRPITGTTAHVLDPHGHPVADGVEGELYLGGNRLALGYVDDAPLTARRFVPDHIFPGDNRRLYRTGDLAIRRPCGAIDFVGRADRQVKVRGFRIQLEELERTALGHPAVRSAVAYVRPSVDGSELGLVVESDALDEPGVRTHLGLHLPPESVPARIAVVAALPLNQNGKVDRAALNAQEPSGDHEHGKNRAEAADIDPAIIGAWRSALATTTCDPDDDFFDLGGSSLQAARMLAEVRTATGVDLPLTAVFECPTLRSLADAVTAQRGAATPAVQQPIFSLRAGHAPPLIVVDCYEGTAFTYRPLLRHLQSGAAVVALDAMRVAGRWRLGESVAVIADACIRQLDKAGIAATPPVLVGSSSGGAVAFEMARRLLERGSRIAGVVLLDPASALPMNAALPPTVAMQKFLTSRGRFHRTWQVSKRAFQRFAHSQGERLRFFYDRLSRARSIEERSRLNIARQRVLMAKYWPQPLPAQVPVLFIACTGDRTDTMLERYMNGWSPLLGGAEQMHRVSGRHAQDDAFLTEPHVGEVARLLGAFLTGLQRR
jgi:thioesterase domain-containing protein/acyl carrier protein